MTISSSLIKKLILPLLSAIIALNPLAIDMYLAAMPIIATDLNSDIASIQNSLSVYLLGYAIGIVLFGPLADQGDRKKMILWGLLGFSFFSIAINFSFNSTQFLILRFFQAFIGSAAMVVIPSLIRDLYPGSLAKGLSYVTMMMMVAPLIAPFIGTWLLIFISWKFIFYALAFYASTVFVLAYIVLPNIINVKLDKKNTPDSNPGKLSFVGNYVTVLRNKLIRFDLLTNMLNAMIFFTYLTAAPFLFIEYYGVSESQFSLLFMSNAFAYLIGTLINAKLVTKKRPRKMLLAALMIALVLATTMLIFVLLKLSLPVIFTTLFCLMTCISILGVNSQALVIEELKSQAGTATGVLGTLKFGSGALMGPVLALLYDASLVPFASLVLLLLIIIACLQWIRYKTLV